MVNKAKDKPPYHVDSTTELLRLKPLLDGWEAELKAFYGSSLVRLYPFGHGLEYHLGQNVREKRRVYITVLLRVASSEVPRDWQVARERNEGTEAILFMKRYTGKVK